MVLVTSADARGIKKKIWLRLKEAERDKRRVHYLLIGKGERGRRRRKKRKKRRRRKRRRKKTEWKTEQV